MSCREFGKRRLIAGHWHNPGLIEQFLAKPILKNEGRELRDRLLRALKAVGPDDAYGDEAPVMLQLEDIERLRAIFESSGNLNAAFGSTKPAHREVGSGKQSEVVEAIVDGRRDRGWQRQQAFAGRDELRCCGSSHRALQAVVGLGMLLEKLHLLAGQFRLTERDAGYVATWLREALYVTARDWVVIDCQDNCWNCFCCRDRRLDKDLRPEGN